MGEELGLGTEVSTHIAKLFSKYYEQCFDPTNFILINYQDACGDTIFNCLRVEADLGLILKPIQDGAARECCPENIKYMTVATKLLFGNNKRMAFTQTFELPMGNVTVLCNNNAATVLNTYPL